MVHGQINGWFQYFTKVSFSYELQAKAPSHEQQTMNHEP
jgi:hypothetical protein